MNELFYVWAGAVLIGLAFAIAAMIITAVLYPNEKEIKK